MNVQEEELKKELEDTQNLSDAGEEFEKKNHMVSIIKTVIYVAILLFCMYATPTFVLQRTVVDGTSMENNFENGENVIAAKCAYTFSNPDRFDVIVFYPYGKPKSDSIIDFYKKFGTRIASIFTGDTEMEEEDEEDYRIKRVVALPGETIQIVGSDILINGKVLEEDYGKMPIKDAGVAEEPIKLGKDEYFVLGDNRQISSDSRDFGVVKKKDIEGKIIFRLN